MRGIREFLGNRIRELREGHGITQDQLANAAQTTQKTIVSVEKGHTSTRVDLLERIAKQLDTSPAVLVGLSPRWGKVVAEFPDLDESEVRLILHTLRSARQPLTSKELDEIEQDLGGMSRKPKSKP